MRQLAITLLLVAALSGCRDEFSPLASGTVRDTSLLFRECAIERPGQQIKAWELTQQQLEQLSTWLLEHQSKLGWLIVTPPVQSLSVALKHVDGSRTAFSLFSNDGWKHTIIIDEGTSKAGVMHISTEDRDALLQLLLRDMPKDAGWVSCPRLTPRF